MTGEVGSPCEDDRDLRTDQPGRLQQIQAIPWAPCPDPFARGWAERVLRPLGSRERVAELGRARHPAGPATRKLPSAPFTANDARYQCLAILSVTHL